MTAFRIARQPSLAPSKKTAPVKDKNYLDWIRELPCLITLQMPVQAAHLSMINYSYGHLGRGKGRKASDRWALPLCPDMHREQHKGSEADFWKRHGIDPHKAALALHGLWSERGDTELACRLIVSRRLGRYERIEQ